jgi:hypothetical protein
MTVSPAARDYRTLLAAASLVAGPLLMTIGDLFHPEERMDPAAQIAILMDDALRWYAAHLLLFVGMVCAIPGFLALAGLTAKRNPAAGHAARILVVIGGTGLAAVFMGEMLIGRFVTDGADAATATALLESMYSMPIAAAVGPALLAFFVGVAVFAIPLVNAGGPLRWIGAMFLIGAACVLVEIVSAQVLLSQIGNIVLFSASAATAWLILRREPIAA